VLYNWLLKLAQSLTPAAYVRLRRRSLIGLGVCRNYRGYRGVAVPAANWLRSLQEVGGFSLRGSESTEITLSLGLKLLGKTVSKARRVGDHIGVASFYYIVVGDTI